MEGISEPLSPVLSALIAFLGIAFTVGTLALIFKQVQGKVIEASDGTRFNSEESCRAYESTLDRLKPLYQESDSSLDKVLGFSQGFLELLKNTGFRDLKTLLKYKGDIQKLVELFDETN